MTIITTFNDKLYNFSGKGLLKSIQKHLPNEKVIIYEELNDIKNAGEIILPEYELININSLNKLKEMLELQHDVIPPKFGGSATKTYGCKFWNKRWFGWFMKVLMAHDAICNKNLDGFVVFVDSDIRFMKNFNDDILARLTNKKPISFFKGTRAAIESGLVVVDANHEESVKFYERYMNFFLSGDFKKLDRWDDGYVMTQLIYFRDGHKVQPEECFNDFAQGKNTTHHTNSNEWKTNQIINSTERDEYVEHDKGMHSIKKVI